jgi:hypothetical protein
MMYRRSERMDTDRKRVLVNDREKWMVRAEEPT